MELHHNSSEEIGKLLSNRYRIERVLGQGGMGKVYLATDTILANERIALKLLREELCRDEKHTQRFIREVQLNRILNHPNVVKVFDVGSHNQALFLTMEFVEGMTLKEKLSEGPLETKEAVYILREICRGLSAVHAANIIHRDLKPGNVIIGKDGSVKIADFGVARPGISDLTAHDEVIGCAPYIAPEVWMGKSVGALADIYALGIIAYEMMSNELPFDADSPGEMMRKHLDARPFPLQQLNAKVPRWLNSLIMRMLEKDPLDRPQGAEEIIEVLDQAEQRGRAAVDSNFALDSGLLNTLQIMEEQAANTSFGPEDVEAPSPKVKPTQALTPANPNNKEDDWLLAEPVEVDEPDYYVPLQAKEAEKTSPAPRIKIQPIQIPVPPSAIKPADTPTPVTNNTIGKIARPRKNTATKIAAEIPAAPITVMSTIRSVVQISLLSSLSVLVVYLLQNPISNAITVLWSQNGGQPPIIMVAFFGYLVAIALCSGLFAVPIIPLALAGSRFLTRFRSWSRSWVHTSLMIAIAALALFSMNLFRFGVETADYSVLNADTIFRILESSMKSLFAIISLVPTLPAGKLGAPATAIQALEMQELPHWISVIVFLGLLCNLIQRHIYGKHSLRSDFVTIPIFMLVAPMMLLENVLQEQIISRFPWLSHDPNLYRIGAFHFEVSRYMLVGAVVNWAAIFAVTAIIAPLMARDKRRKNLRN